MNNAFGIDFGTRMIKLATVVSSQAKPQLIPLSKESPFLPSCVSIEGEGTLGWKSLHELRRKPEANLECFRNMSNSDQAELELGGKIIASADLLEFVIELLGSKLNQLSASGLVVLGVPDILPNGGWGLGAGLGRSSWKPAATVRESVAVWRTLHRTPSTSVVLVSCGSSGLTATQVQRTGKSWEFVGKSHSAQVSGKVLHDKLAEKVAQVSIQTVRTDPREDSEEDQVLHNACTELLIQLCTNNTAQANITGDNRSIPVTENRGALTTLIPNCKLHWQEFITALHDPETRQSIYLWGELSQLLPLSDWTTEIVGSDVEVEVLNLDVVANGCALIAADIAAKGIEHFNYQLGEIGSADGRWEHSEATRISPGCIPLINSLLVQKHGVEISLELFDDNGAIEHNRFPGPSISIGRDPQCSFSLDQDEYPMVSGKHTEITAVGSEFYLEDQQSTNGTFLDGNQVSERTVIRDGAEIRLGLNGPRFRFQLNH